MPKQRTFEAPTARRVRDKTRVPVDLETAQQALYARREHSKGDDNLPRAEPHPGLVDERTEDRTPHDLPKERDDRSAPKGNIIAGQEARNPDLDVRDDFEPELAGSPSGFERAQKAADVATRARAPRKPARPNARRSSAAKKKVATRPRSSAGRAKTNVRQAPKSAERTARRSALARRPQVGIRRTGTAPRGDAVPRAARGNVRARAAAKAKRRG